MIRRSEANDLVSFWVADAVRVRVDFRAEAVNFSAVGTLEAAGAGLVRIRLADGGFMEMYLDSSWRFDYFDPDALRVAQADRLGRDHKGAIQKTGAGLHGLDGSSSLLILEVVSGGSDTSVDE